MLIGVEFANRTTLQSDSFDEVEHGINLSMLRTWEEGDSQTRTNRVGGELCPSHTFYFCCPHSISDEHLNFVSFFHAQKCLTQGAGGMDDAVVGIGCLVTEGYLQAPLNT